MTHLWAPETRLDRHCAPHVNSSRRMEASMTYTDILYEKKNGVAKFRK